MSRQKSAQRQKMRSTTHPAVHLIELDDTRILSSTLTDANVERLRKCRIELYCDELGMPLWPQRDLKTQAPPQLTSQNLDAALAQLDEEEARLKKKTHLQPKSLRRRDQNFKLLTNCGQQQKLRSPLSSRAHPNANQAFGMRKSYDLKLAATTDATDDGETSTDGGSSAIADAEVHSGGEWPSCRMHQCEHCGSLLEAGHNSSAVQCKPTLTPRAARRRPSVSSSTSSAASLSSSSARGRPSTPRTPRTSTRPRRATPRGGSPARAPSSLARPRTAPSSSARADVPGPRLGTKVWRP